MPVLLSELHARRGPCRSWSGSALPPAQLGGLDGRKGQISAGADADLLIWDHGARTTSTIAAAGPALAGSRGLFAELDRCRLDFIQLAEADRSFNAFADRDHVGVPEVWVPGALEPDQEILHGDERDVRDADRVIDNLPAPLLQLLGGVHASALVVTCAVDVDEGNTRQVPGAASVSSSLLGKTLTRSAPASKHAQARRIPSSYPWVRIESVRAQITKSGSHRAASAALSLTRNSFSGTTCSTPLW
jgi:hypothetical protein